MSGDFQAVVADLHAAEDGLVVPPSAKSMLQAVPDAADSAWETLVLSDMALKFAVSPRSCLGAPMPPPGLMLTAAISTTGLHATLPINWSAHI